MKTGGGGGGGWDIVGCRNRKHWPFCKRTKTYCIAILQVVVFIGDLDKHTVLGVFFVQF